MGNGLTMTGAMTVILVWNLTMYSDEMRCHIGQTWQGIKKVVISLGSLQYNNTSLIPRQFVDFHSQMGVVDLEIL